MNTPIRTTQLFILFLFLISTINMSSCQSNHPSSPFPFKLFNTYHSNKEITDKLRIPFLENEKYGLCDYEGNIIISPRFEKIELINFHYNFFWAGKYDSLSLYDINGNQVLNEFKNPIFKDSRYIQIHNLRRMEGKNEIIQTIFAIPSTPVQKTKTVSNKNEKSAQKYLFLFDNLKPPYKFYSLVKHEDHRTSPNERNFLSNPHVKIGHFMKVKTDNGLHTYLDENGKELIPPVFDCHMITKGLFKVRKEKGGKIALVNYKEDWETDYKFWRIMTSRNNDIFRGMVKGESNFMIYDKGKIKKDEKNGGWNVIDEKYTVFETRTEDKKSYVLWDNDTFQPTTIVENDKLPRIYSYFKKRENKQSFLESLRTTDGNPVIIPDQHIKPISDSLFIQVDYTKNLTYLKKDGTKIVQINQGKQIQVLNDLIKFKDGDDKFGIVSKKGKLILPFEFEEIDLIKNSNFMFAKKENHFKIYNIDGEQMSDLKFDNIERVRFHESKLTDIFSVSYKDASFDINQNLKIISENDHENKIIKKSYYKINTENPSIIKDFEEANLPSNFDNFIIFYGREYIHIFQIDGVYITSLSGQFLERGILIKSEFNKKENQRESTGIIKMEKDGKEFWVRLIDGKKYVGE